MSVISLNSCPQDVLISISKHLSLQDVCSLRETCKAMFEQLKNVMILRTFKIFDPAECYFSEDLLTQLYLNFKYCHLERQRQLLLKAELSKPGDLPYKFELQRTISSIDNLFKTQKAHKADLIWYSLFGGKGKYDELPILLTEPKPNTKAIDYYMDHIPYTTMTAPVMRGEDHLNRRFVCIRANEERGVVFFDKDSTRPGSIAAARLRGMPSFIILGQNLCTDTKIFDSKHYAAIAELLKTGKTTDPFNGEQIRLMTQEEIGEEQERRLKAAAS